MSRRVSAAAIVLAMVINVGGCASVPKGRYGVEDLDWKGVDKMSEEALSSCIATKERDALHLQLGFGGSSCGEPPFDEHVPSLKAWSWPWTTWPIYDDAIFEIDEKRVVRWYQARGFYDARVVSVKTVADGKPLQNPSECDASTGSCEIAVTVQVEEGKPVLVSNVEVVADTPLPLDLHERLLKQVDLRVRHRFDENTFAGDEQRLQRALQNRGYARAKVEGQVSMDRSAHRAAVRYRVTTGPLCRFGTASVSGEGNLNRALILDVAHIPTGKPYSQTEVSDAERAVYALGTFTSVRIDPVESDPSDPVVNVVIHVMPGRDQSLRLGVGVMSGVLTAGGNDEAFSVPEWDVHLRAQYRNDNFIGGMRRLHVEDRPRLIMLESFPQIPNSGPRVGNTVQLTLEQPRFLEHRTVLFTAVNWDLGPDPFFGFFRNAITTQLGVRRAFFGQKLQVSFAAAHDFYQITDSHRPSNVSSYRLPYLDQEVKLDLRNDAQRPRRGFYAANTLQEAFRLGYGSWNYIRWLPEMRGYEPLPFHIVLAQRLAFGALFVTSANPAMDPSSRALGPQEYRLRGGGANSDRGFAPGQLGDGIDGGKRRWEGSFEARVPLSSDFGLVLFFDVGDVNRGKRMRFDHVNAATGLGFRYYSLFVPVRLDLGWRIPGWQVIGGPEPRVKVGVLPSAAHLTIGEAF